MVFVSFLASSKKFAIATEGENNSPQPGWYDMVGKYKWNAWKELGSMEKEDAMKQVSFFFRSLFSHLLMFFQVHRRAAEDCREATSVYGERQICRVCNSEKSCERVTAATRSNGRRWDVPCDTT